MDLTDFIKELSKVISKQIEEQSKAQQNSNQNPQNAENLPKESEKTAQYPQNDNILEQLQNEAKPKTEDVLGQQSGNFSPESEAKIATQQEQNNSSQASQKEDEENKSTNSIEAQNTARTNTDTDSIETQKDDEQNNNANSIETQPKDENKTHTNSIEQQSQDQSNAQNKINYNDYTASSIYDLKDMLQKTEEDSDFALVEPNTVYNEELGLTKKEMPTTTEEEIRSAAEAEANANKQQKQQDIQSDYDSNTKMVDYQKKALEQKVQSAQSETNIAYNEARTKAENDALRRGLARSSAVLFALADIEKSRAHDLASQQQTLNDNLQKLEDQLQLLESKKNAALANLDIQAAVEAQKNIDKRLAELKKQQDEVLEYNNKVQELEAKYKLQLAEKQKKLAAEAAEETAAKNETIKKNKESAQLALLVNYFSKFDKKTALNEITKNTDLANLVGVDTYYRLYKRIAEA